VLAGDLRDIGQVMPALKADQAARALSTPAIGLLATNST